MKMTIEIKYKKGDKVYYINDENFYHGTVDKVDVETDHDGNIKIRYNITADGRWLAHYFVKQEYMFLTKEGLKGYVLSQIDKLK